MAVLNREEFFKRLNGFIGDRTGEETVGFLEDMTDTYNSMENHANGDGVDWHQKYDELNKSWEERYKHRFFNGGDRSVPMHVPGEDSENAKPEYDPDAVTIDSLFKGE